LFLFCFTTNNVFAAIEVGNSAYDADQESGITTFDNDGTYLFISINTTSDDITGVTFNGDAMYEVGTSQYFATYDRYFYAFVLPFPDEGEYDVVISGGANWQIDMITFTGVDGYEGLDTFSGSGASGMETFTLTSTVPDTVGVLTGIIQNGYSGVGSNTTVEVNNTGGNFFIFSSDPVSSPGDVDLEVNVGSGDNYSFKGIVLKPESEEEPPEPVIPASAKVPFGPVPSLYFIMGLSFVQLGAFFLLATVIVKMTIFPIKRIWRGATGNLKTR